MRITQNMSLAEKLNILSDAAKYDVACTSSGTDRKNDGTGIGNCAKRESATAFRQMEDVFRFSRFCLQMSASMIANIVLTELPMMYHGHLSHRMRYVT